jgi:hypothetical protein
MDPNEGFRISFYNCVSKVQKNKKGFFLNRISACVKGFQANIELYFSVSKKKFFPVLIGLLYENPIEN